MLEFFTTYNDVWDDGSLKLKAVGIMAVIIIILALVLVAALVRQKNEEKKKALTARQIAYSAVALALAMVCSMIKFSSLPMGGSITLFSMLFVVLIANWYGPYVGIMTAVAYGLLQFVVEPYFYTLPQMLVDYPLAFGALGLAGFFYKKKHGLLIGYLVGVLGRYVFAVISGYIFFGAYAPEGTPAIVYSLTYNGTYLVPEAIVTVILLAIPTVAKAIDMVKKKALMQ